ncbi:MAG: phospholipase D family protein [bacterium]|nr:phospholipase D family protein [bacterium]
MILWKDGFPERNADGGWGVNTAVDVAFFYGIALLIAHVVRKFLHSTRFCTDSELRQEILNCVADSKDWLVIVSPYLDPGNVVAEAVLKAQGRGVDVKLYTHTKQVHDPTARAVIGRLGARGVKIFHHPNLHAKLCINERHVVVSSLNLVAGSFVDSYEAGISTNDDEVRSEARKYIERTIAQSDLCTRLDEADLSPPHGYCIRTGEDQV